METVLTVRLDGELLRRLDEEAARAQLSRSRLIREILRARLQRRSTSAFDVLAPYSGIFDGPTDLSTKPKHFKGMGRKPGRR